MKKAVLFFFFFNLFFNQTSHALSLVTNQEVLSNNALSKEKIENRYSFNDSLIDFVFYKNDIVSDNDNDNDNEEVESQTTSITKKTADYTISYFNTVVGKLHFVEIKSYPKIYYSANTSRLPRFNYISLRVLRL